MDKQDSTFLNKQITQKNTTELRKTLVELLQEYQPSIDRYQWPIESQRWNELVFCILRAIGTDQSARSATKVLMELNLLDAEILASLDPAAAVHNAQRREVVIGILREAGFNQDLAELSISALAHIAEKVNRDWEGRIQRLLRRESKSLIDHVVNDLDLTGLDTPIARQAVTFWLQNVLNLPVYLDTEGMQALCAKLHVKPSDLVTAADELDINLAILDDLVEMWYKSEKEIRALEQEIIDFEETAAVQSSDKNLLEE